MRTMILFYDSMAWLMVGCSVKAFCFEHLFLKSPPHLFDLQLEILAVVGLGALSHFQVHKVHNRREKSGF